MMHQVVAQGNLDVYRLAALHSPLPHAAWEARDQNYQYVWGVDYVCANGLIEKDLHRIPTNDEIDRAIAHFSSKQLPFMWWTSANTLEAKGFQFGGSLSGIALDITRGIPPEPATAADLSIKIIRSEEEIKAWNTIVAHAFGMGERASQQFLNLNTALMKQGEYLCFLACINDVPVGAATLVTGLYSAGIWSLATLPEYRKQGVGAALVHAALIEAQRLQYSHVMAVLMPKGMAWGIFRKFGFVQISELPFYVYGVAADEIEK
jgi:ribosomal protein S18 acetylase RimI-like enzyme